MRALVFQMVCAAVLAASVWVTDANASGRDEITVSLIAINGMHALKDSDRKTLGALMESDAGAAEKLAELLQERMKVGYDLLEIWDGTVKGVTVAGKTATVWLCKKNEAMFLAELARSGDGWKLEDIALYVRR